MTTAFLLAAAILLQGVTGRDLRARAFFDANNVKVGDPMVLTIDFLGDADFHALHPPALSRAVAAADWKLDDASAKTDTFRDARRLTYRIRPMREGVLWFPALEFKYLTDGGVAKLVRANEIPAHVRAGAQVEVVGMDAADEEGMPSPPDLVASPAHRMTDDVAFAWRKALAKPSAAAFREFDFPEARMNEATCLIREGNWAEALKVYAKLEWRIGQTPEIERGIVAALALRHDNPSVELPMWRQVLRPLLRWNWKGRVGIVLGGFLLAALAFYLLGRGIRAVACLLFAALLALPAAAETVETVTTNADGSIVHRKVVRGGNGSFSYSFTSSSSSGGAAHPGGGFGGLFNANRFAEGDDSDPFGFGGFFGRRAPKPKIVVSLAPDRKAVTVGENFNLILSVDLPKYVSIAGGLQLSLAERDKMQIVGGGRQIESLPSDNVTNVVRRYAFPLRANERVGELHYEVAFMYMDMRRRSFFSSEARYESGPRLARLTVNPLPAEGQPPDFSGIIGGFVGLSETCDLLRVGTNDVVTITYSLRSDGYVPASFLPKGAAFEWRREDLGGGRSAITYRRYFVADGAPQTPRLTVNYYDPQAKAYKTAATGGTSLTYVAED